MKISMLFNKNKCKQSIDSQHDLCYVIILYIVFHFNVLFMRYIVKCIQSLTKSKNKYAKNGTNRNNIK